VRAVVVLIHNVEGGGIVQDLWARDDVVDRGFLLFRVRLVIRFTDCGLDDEVARHGLRLCD